MPRRNTTVETAAAFRRCPGCCDIFPANRTYFYTYPSGRLERCNEGGNDCHGRYYRARAEARRSGSRVTRSTRVDFSGLSAEGQRFGLEIEFCGATHEAVARALTQAGVPCTAEGYNHETRSYWKVITDASVQGGGELVSPPLSGDAGRAELKTVINALHSIGVTVNSSCGLHVHHDMSGHTPASFGRSFQFWLNNQDHVDMLVARSRRTSQWCRRLTQSEVNHIGETVTTCGMNHRRTSFRVDRYKTLNVQSFPRYGTVEVRQHQGTTNARKILAWVAFGQAVFAYAASEAPVTRFATVNDMLDALALSGNLEASTAQYLKDRAVALGSHRAETPEPATFDPDGERCACGEPLDADGRCPRMFTAAMAV